MSATQPGRPQLYKDVLTLTLHKRFLSAYVVLSLVCYVVAVLISDKSSYFWSWFPLGPALFRTAVLSISTLMIFILRVAQLHIGRRTASSPFRNALGLLFSRQSLQTLFWYLLSAFCYTELYLWSAPLSSNLALKADTKSYERPYLNERPLYLRSVFYLLAVIQSLVHLVYDYDQIRLPAPKPYSKSPSRGPDNAVLSPRERLRSDLPQRAQAAVLRCLALAVLGPLVYSLFLRRMVWEWTSFAVRVSNYIPKSSSAPPSTPPYRFPLIVRSVLSGYLLVILWETAAVAFEAFFAQEPLKSSVPLTNDCRDQNGTLLTGLKSKREIPQTFAFWELGLICHEFPERRKTIFEEIDRKGGSTWSQTLNASLGVLQSLDSRIKAALSPPTQQPTPANQPQPGSLQALPRITPPIKQEPIYAGTRPPQTRRERIEVTVGSFARSHGKTPAPTKNDATPLALSKRLSSYVLDKSLSPRQKQILSYSYIKSKTHGYVLDFLRSPLGVPFQRTLDRRAAAIVLGSPTGDAGVLVDAIEAVTVLASHSLKEDTYGKVQQDVPSIVRALTGSINQLELLQQSLQPHWTDVEADQRDRAHDLSDVVFLLHHLRASLTQIINDFGRYAHNVGIGAKELRAAKRAAGIELEEQEEDEVPPNGRQRRGR